MTTSGWVALMGLLVLPLFGAWTDSWSSMRKAASEVQTLDAEFVQTKKLEILQKPIVSRGRLRYRRPQDLRWEYTSPLKSVLIASPAGVKRYVQRDGKWVPDAGAKLEAVRAVIAEMNLWMKGQFQQSKVFSARLVAGTPTRVELSPRDEALKKYLSQVTLELAETPGVVQAIEIREGPKSSTRIELVNPKLNSPLSDDLFKPLR